MGDIPFVCVGSIVSKGEEFVNLLDVVPDPRGQEAQVPSERCFFPFNSLFIILALDDGRLTELLDDVFSQIVSSDRAIILSYLKQLHCYLSHLFNLVTDLHVGVHLLRSENIHEVWCIIRGGGAVCSLYS